MVARGFSLIELMIVISLFAIITILATISYISFEGGQRLKNGALQIKSDLRLAQSSAQSGDKGAGSCLTGSKLAGWYATFNSAAGSNSSYTIAGDCLDASNNETSYSSGTYNLPQGVTILEMRCGPIGSAEISHSLVTPVSILFRPLEYSVSFYSSAALDFFTAAGALNSTNLLSGTELLIKLQSADGSYYIKMNSSGQVSESKTF